MLIHGYLAKVAGESRQAIIGAAAEGKRLVGGRISQAKGPRPEGAFYLATSASLGLTIDGDLERKRGRESSLGKIGNVDPTRADRLQESSAVELLGTERLPATVATLVSRLARGLKAFYGERYRGLVLYGSYARGEADEGSDVDLLLLLEGEVDPARELLRAEEVKWPLSLDAGYTVSLLPVSVEAYRHPKQPFLRNAREEGVLLA